jgi:chlorobactene glucosyltransferase
LSNLWFQHQIGLLLFLIGLNLIALSNRRWFRRVEHVPPPAHWPKLSVLIPARNEEDNITSCLTSLVGQEYSDFEVLVLDDDSSDGTAERVQAIAARDSRVVYRRGAALPDGWLGKHWACQQLAQQAGGDWLLFVDADTVFAPGALRALVSAGLAEEADLLSAVPLELLGSWGERLVLPFFLWANLTFLPLGLAYRLKAPRLSFAVGQVMLFRRSAYDQIGGHAAVRENVVDDLALAQQVKAAGLRWRLMNGGGVVRCRMYHTFEQVWNGLRKNMFAAFGYNKFIFAFIWLWMLLMTFEPLAVCALWLVGVPVAGLSAGLALAAIGLLWLTFFISYGSLGFPRWLTVFYPLTVVLNVAVALSSLFGILRGNADWKGRPVRPLHP